MLQHFIYTGGLELSPLKLLKTQPPCKHIIPHRNNKIIFESQCVMLEQADKESEEMGEEPT